MVLCAAQPCHTFVDSSFGTGVVSGQAQGVLAALGFGRCRQAQITDCRPTRLQGAADYAPDHRRHLYFRTAEFLVVRASRRQACNCSAMTRTDGSRIMEANLPGTS